MPIYEFRCLTCDKIFELLFIGSGDAKEMKCPYCSSDELSRVMSTTNYNMGASSSSSIPETRASTKACGSGSCGTLEIPGRHD